MTHPDKIKKFADNISKAKAEDLILLAKYSKRKRLFFVKIQSLISSVIATIAGALVFAGYLFPETGKQNIIIGATLFGIFTVSLSFYMHRKGNKRALSEYLRDLDDPSQDDIDEAEKYRQEIIEIIKKEEN